MMKTTGSAKRIALLGILTAVALVLGYLEYLIPLGGVPGIKLGLANTVLLYALILLDLRSAWLLMLLKVGLSGLLFGGPAALLYSLSGGILSLLGMTGICRIPRVSVIGVSICGAVLHNIGQMLVACAVVGIRPVLAYLPLLLAAAAMTGTLTGIVAKYVIRGLNPARTGAAHSDQAKIAANGETEHRLQPGEKS